MVYEDEFAYAFRDIAPVAPTHVLVIPKVKDGLSQLSKVGLYAICTSTFKCHSIRQRIVTRKFWAT